MTRDRNNPDQPESANGLDPAARSARPLSADLQAHIGVRLKAYYDSVLSEPIPTRFAELLDRLDADEPHPASTSAGAASSETRSDPIADDPGDGAGGTDVTS